MSLDSSLAPRVPGPPRVGAAPLLKPHGTRTLPGIPPRPARARPARAVSPDPEIGGPILDGPPLGTPDAATRPIPADDPARRLGRAASSPASNPT